MKEFIKQLLSYKLVVPLLQNKAFIVVYHDVSETNEPTYNKNYSTTLTNFKAHLLFFKTHFNCITLDDLLNNTYVKNNKPLVVITFDDGFKSIKNNVLPLINEHNIPITLFLNGKAIEQGNLWVTNFLLNNEVEFYANLLQLKNATIKHKNELLLPLINAPVQEQLQHEKLNCSKDIYLNTKDIEELKTNTNISFANHTYTHYNLNAVLLNTAITDVKKNEHYLNETLKIKSKHLAIPFGKQEHFNNEIIESLGSNNYTSALTTNPNAINLTALNSNKYKQSGVHILPRIGLTNESVNDLLFLINRTIFKNYEI